MKKVKKDKELENEIEDKINEKEFQGIESDIIIDPTKLSWFSTNSIPLNLAMSQRGRSGGIPRGRISNIVGDGSSGKSLVSIELCANVFYKQPKSHVFPKTKKITIHYNNSETVLDFSLDEMYGSDFVKGVIWKNITTVEETGYDIARVLKSKKDDEGVLYIVDSLDGLKSEKLFEEFNKIADNKVQKKGSYDLDKQKFLTRDFFPNICKMMEDIDFTLVIISQTRDKIGGLFPEKTRSGGSALNFYTHLVTWLSVSDHLEKTVEGQKLTRGVKIKAKVKRSKVSKPFRESESIIIYNFGVDNIGSCLNYLLKYADSYSTPELVEKVGLDPSILPEKKINRTDLTRLIEDNNLEDFLSDKVESVWLAREEVLHEPRKRKF